MVKDATQGVRVISNCDPENVDRDDVLRSLDDSGVILFRGLDFSLDLFELFTAIFCDDFHTVGTRVKLRKQQGDGLSTEVFRSNFSLLAHSEGTYRPWPPPPDLCFFYCITPPVEKGGETTLVDGTVFYERLPEDLRGQFTRHGVIYQSHWEPARWQAEFGVGDADELKQLLGRFSEVEFNLDHENLNVRYRAGAIVMTEYGRPAFANAILAHLPCINHPGYRDKKAYAKADNRVFFGNGEEINSDAVNKLIDIHDDTLIAHRWEAGDLLLIDNKRFMHGRRMTESPCDRILISRFGTRRKDNRID